MVVKMMKWRPWPPLTSKKFEAKITVKGLKGLSLSQESMAEKPMGLQDLGRFSVEIRWKGSKGNPLSSLRRRVRRNFTKVESLGEDGVVEWNEEFQSVCNFSASKEGIFHPWEVVFSVVNTLDAGQSNKVSVIAAVTLNLAEYAPAAGDKDVEISIPVPTSGSTESSASLCLSLSLVELRTSPELPEVTQRSVMSVPVSPIPGEVQLTDKNELSSLKHSLKKVKLFKGLSSRRQKKASTEEEGSDGRSSVRSEDIEYNYPFDTDSLDDVDEGESDDVKEDSTVRKSFSYGTLAYVNHAGQLSYSNTSGSEDEDLVYYSHRKSDVGQSHPESAMSSVTNETSQQSAKRGILPWRKRKLSFRSPKVKGEPLLKKYYGEEGGDDIDYDRRQLSSSDESTLGGQKPDEDSGENQQLVSEFGDDNFAVGSWEQKEVVSRDGQFKLQTQVFFASIDQRSERAAGEGACTALVAVIADWFQSNPNEMPIKSQLDSLIREGSLEWRNLCDNEAYRERFPDKHFDLETVLQAKIRPLSVVPEKSFIGFFHPDGVEGGGFGFLQGAMSFDNIWDEMSQYAPKSSYGCDPVVYIFSWNDHFFILKVEEDAYYIIDTLGERLFEGCNQAFILKFDKDTIIQQLPVEAEVAQPSDDKSGTDKGEQDKCNESAAEGETVANTDVPRKVEEPIIVSKGKESCKEYIKSFLAAIPIRELLVDLKKGLMASTPLHHRLQIELHYTKCLHPMLESS